jgi:predicted AAA+ superfamily ATPase
MVGSPYPRILTTPRSSFFLFGVRGVGKSTWARQEFAAARRFDLLDESVYQDLLASPALFADALRSISDGDWVVVDEVQRIPALLNEVHRAIEERGLKFVLMGSSARKLKTGGSNLLAGRAQWKQFHPLVPEELGVDFDLEKVLRHGSIPIVWTAENPEITLRSYVQLYLREEIRAEALVRNLPGFARFLPVAALFHGQALNVSGLARDAGASRTTVTGYLDILEDTLVTIRLPGFEPRLRTRERKLPKLYWIDPGLVRALKKSSGPVLADERGALFEGWILALLRAYDDYRGLYDEIAYWAPLQARDLEVDFLLRRGRESVAIEAKSSRRPSKAQLTGLRAVNELPGLVRRVLVYTGSQEAKTADGIDLWPVPTFLTKLAQGQLWP